MTTRSSFKCFISGITLTVDESIVIEDKIISKQLASAWTKAYGQTFPDGTLMSTTNETDAQTLLLQTSMPLKSRQQAFITNEFNALMTNCFVGLDLFESYTYLKVLIGFLFSVDPRLCFETLTKATNSCEMSDTPETLEALTYVLKNVTSNMITNPKRVIAELDELKMQDQYNSSILIDILNVLPMYL